MQSPSAHNRSEWRWLALLFAVVTVFHVRGLRPGYAFLPIDIVNNNFPWRTGPFALGGLQNVLIGDPIYQFYPFLVNQVEAVRSGYWPLWSSRILLGHPLLGDPLAQTFYPVFLGLGLVFGPARGLTLGFWLHAVLAAGLTYAWLRTARIGQAGALAGSLAYALGGFMVTWFETPFWVSTLSWLPGVLWMYARAVRRKSLADTAAAGAMLGVAALAGQLSFILTFCVFLVLYGVGHLVQAARERHRFDACALIALAITFGIGGLLAATQVLPFVEALAQSHRSGGVGLGTAPWHQVVTWLVPNFYGNPSTTREYWGGLNYSEGVLYAGVVTLFLAVLAPIISRRFWPIYLFCLGAATLYLAYGGPGASLLAFVPLAKYIALSRSLFLLPLVIGYLAGSALDATGRPGIWTLLAAAAGFAALVAAAWIGNWGGVQAHAAQVRLPLLWAGALLAATILLLIARGAAPRLRTSAAWLLVGLIFVDLFANGSRFNPALPIASLPQPTPAISFLQDHALLYRVATVQSTSEILFGPNYLSVFGLRDLSGYSSLLPRALTQLVAAGDRGSGGYNSNTIWLGSPSLRLIDLLQAGFVVSKDPRGDQGVRAAHLGGCAGQTRALAADQPVSGTIMVASTAINRLDLTLRVAPGAQPGGGLIVRMWQGADRARLVLQSQADLSHVVDHQTLTFYFAPENDAPGNAYVWEAATANKQTKVALCAEDNGEPSVSLYGADWQPAYQGELQIAERLGRLPRAYVVYSVESIADEQAAISRVLDGSFDLRNAAVVGQRLALPSRAEFPATAADIVSYGDLNVVLHVTTTRAGLLVLGDQAYPGWQAWVDGQPAAVLIANVVWRGVLLEPGEHQVEFKFDPLSLKLGLALTALGLIVAVALMLIGKQFTFHPLTPVSC